MKKKYDEIIIESHPQNVILVQNMIEGICDQYNIPNHYGQLSVAIIEAVENAIKHGNGSDKSKKVSIKAKKSFGGISFKITDEGKGFNTKKYESLDDVIEHGNGIFLMKTLSNRVTFLDKGRSVELFFSIDGISSSKALERKSLMEKYFAKEGTFAKQTQKSV